MNIEQVIKIHNHAHRILASFPTEFLEDVLSILEVTVEALAAYEQAFNWKEEADQSTTLIHQGTKMGRIYPEAEGFRGVILCEYDQASDSDEIFVCAEQSKELAKQKVEDSVKHIISSREVDHA